jgi:hypothetical protein
LGFLRSVVIGLLVLVALISVAFIGYSSLNPHVVTVTQQQLLTNTQSLYSVQTLTSVSMVTSFQTVTSVATAGYGNGYTGPGYTYYPNYQSYPNCSSYGCYYWPPAYASIYDLCQSPSQNSTVQCSGYIHQPTGACTELAIPYYNPEILESTAYMYLTLYNLPANHPPSGSWVTITGELNQGYTPGAYGPLCTNNYINVTSLS